LFALLLAGLAITTVLINLWISHEPVTKRFHELPEDVQTVDARPAAWLASLRVGMRAPLIGAGAGTFEDQVRILPDTGLFVRYNHAHCDPLEIFAETGTAGLLSLFGAIIWVLFSAARALSTRHSRFARALAVGGLTGIIAVLFHSLFDFPLQIPGVRIPLFAMLAGVYLVAHRRLTR
jgi:O-antigen ligase